MSRTSGITGSGPKRTDRNSKPGESMAFPGLFALYRHEFRCNFMMAMVSAPSELATGLL